jgi:acetoin utilization deacetylase AcuC-like enzyme
MITFFYHPDFVVSLGDHIMPIQKFSLVAKEIMPWQGTQITPPAPVTEENLLLIHTQEYIDAIKTGEPKLLAESQKFPWSSDLFRAVTLTNGACIAAASQALKDGVSCALASGFHHAHADHGEGFCTFNGLIIALEILHRENKIKSAAILDMDLHYGNGTASFLNERPFITSYSLYGNDYMNNKAFPDVKVRQHKDGKNHLSFALPENCDRTTMFKTMDKVFALILEKKPEIILYQAGADYFKEDPYSTLNLDYEDLYERDLKVFRFAKENKIPMAWVLAGGYTQPIEKVVKVHTNTVKACLEVFK